MTTDELNFILVEKRKMNKKHKMRSSILIRFYCSNGGQIRAFWCVYWVAAADMQINTIIRTFICVGPCDSYWKKTQSNVHKLAKPNGHFMLSEKLKSFIFNQMIVLYFKHRFPKL